MAKNGNTSETLEKGLRILDLFRGEEPGFTLGQIAERVGINKTSVYRYVNTFRQLGYLQRDARTGLYRLGVRTLALAHTILQKNEMVRLVKPLVDEVHKRLDLHVDVGIVANDAIYLIYRRQSKDTQAFRSFTHGSGLYYLAAGKAALAYMAADELDSLLGRLSLEPKTDRTIVDRQRLLEDLKASRARGWARNQEEFVPGLIAIGAPLFNLHTGQVVGGVSFDSSTAQFSMEDFEHRYAALLVELAKKISAAVSG